MSVLHEWVEKLPLKQQVTLISAIRGPDDGCKEAKELARRLRAAVLKNADKKESFMSPSLEEDLELGVLEYKSRHFTKHLQKAAERVADSHPDELVRYLLAVARRDGRGGIGEPSRPEVSDDGAGRISK